MVLSGNSLVRFHQCGNDMNAMWEMAAMFGESCTSSSRMSRARRSCSMYSVPGKCKSQVAGRGACSADGWLAPSPVCRDGIEGMAAGGLVGDPGRLELLNGSPARVAWAGAPADTIC